VCSKLEAAFADALGQCAVPHYAFEENGIEADSQAMAFVQNYRDVKSPNFASKIAQAIFDRINGKINDIRNDPTAIVGADARSDPALMQALDAIRGADDEHASELIANFVSLVNQRLNLERSRVQPPALP
jgi:hypothetical protein